MIATIDPYIEGTFEPTKVYGMICTHFNLPISERPYFVECEIEDDPFTETEFPVPGTCFYYEQKEDNDGR